MQLKPVYRKVAYPAIGILLAIYLVNCFTPLRVNYDIIRYFALKETIEGTWPAEFGTQTDFLPYGYVLLLLGLSKLGLLNSFVISFIHLLYLAGSLYFVCRIFAPRVNYILLILLTLLNWTTIKFGITPVSEMQFLFFSTGALFFYHQLASNKKRANIIWLAIFITAAVFTRVVGLLLVLAIAIAFISKYFNTITGWLRSRVYAWISLVLLCLVALFLLWQLKFITYIGYLIRPLTDHPKEFFTVNIQKHLLDWASIFINAPVEKFKFLSFYPWVVAAYTIAGIFFLLIIGIRVFSKRYTIPLAIRIYLVLYVLLIFNWPFFEPRFWLPVLPLIFAIILQPFNLTQPFYRVARVSAGVLYAIAGILVLGYYTYLTFDKKAFALQHENGIYRPEYEWHFFKTTAPRSPYWYPDTVIFKKAQYIIEKYD